MAGADERVRASTAELGAALTGPRGAHPRFLWQQQLRHVDALDTQLQALDAEGATRRAPLTATRELRESLPGVKTRVAETLRTAGGPDGGGLSEWRGTGQMDRPGPREP